MTIPQLPQVIIGLCTRKRPEMLRDCLDSLSRLQVGDADKEFFCRIILIVVENDHAALSRLVVDEFSRHSPFPVFYHLETDIGIAQARNRAIQEASAIGFDWFWFLDDDEIADSRCLEELLRAAREHDAQVVHGRIIRQYPAADRWAKLADSPRAPIEHGKKIHCAATNNVLFSSKLVSKDGLGLLFDPVLGLSGGEDTLFFKQATRSGAMSVYSAKAVVYETVPESRCTLDAVMDRQARITSSGVYIDRQLLGQGLADKKHRRRLRQNALQLVAAILALPGLLAWDLLHGRSNALQSRLLRLALKIATLRKRLQGLSGRLHDSYSVIHGQ